MTKKITSMMQLKKEADGQEKLGTADPEDRRLSRRRRGKCESSVR